MTLGPRAGLSSVLIAGSIVLLISIVVGNSMGNRVLRDVAHRADDFAPSPVASQSPDPDEQSGPAQGQWKRHQIVSVATDPGFPDPRITPEPPPPPPPPRPAPKLTPTPAPEATSHAKAHSESPYTSPPLPLPIVSHDPNEQSDPYGEPLPTMTPSPDGAGAATASPRSDASPGHAAMATP